MQHIKFFLLLIPSILISYMIFEQYNKNTVLFCYGKVNPNMIKNYNFVILEQDLFTKAEINVIKKSNKKVLAYISLGEINAHSKYFKDLKDNTLGKNKNWNSHYLNLKSEKTRNILISAIQEALNKNFDGMFLDNIDNYSPFGPQKDDHNELSTFLKTISEKFPKNIFIQNAGIDLLPETNKFIDGVVVESVASNYTFINKKYNLRDEKDFQSRINRINEASENYKLNFILVEYADSKALYDKIVNRLKAYKYDYFIGKIDLQSIPNYSTKK